MLPSKHHAFATFKHADASLARTVANGRATAESALRQASEGNEYPCARCIGFGSYYESTDGKRLARNTTNVPDGFTFCGTCPDCRGLGRLFGSVHEVRRAYRHVRAKVCRDKGIRRADFDESVERVMMSRETRRIRGLCREVPGHWVHAAIEVAVDEGTTP